MVTKGQAMETDHFHYGECTLFLGKRGGLKIQMELWRRNGKTKIWKRDRKRFRVPIKHGLYATSAITELNAGEFHTETDCPLLAWLDALKS